MPQADGCNHHHSFQIEPRTPTGRVDWNSLDGAGGCWHRKLLGPLYFWGFSNDGTYGKNHTSYHVIVSFNIMQLYYLLYYLEISSSIGVYQLGCVRSHHGCKDSRKWPEEVGLGIWGCTIIWFEKNILYPRLFTSTNLCFAKRLLDIFWENLPTKAPIWYKQTSWVVGKLETGGISWSQDAVNIKLRAWQNSSDLKENHSTARQHTERDHPLTKKKLSGGAMPSSGMPHSAASKSIFGDASHDGSATETHSFSVPGISGLLKNPFSTMSWHRRCWSSSKNATSFHQR